MGLYYLIIFIIGIVLLIVGIRKTATDSVKKGIISSIIGFLFIVATIILYLIF